MSLRRRGVPGAGHPQGARQMPRAAAALLIAAAAGAAPGAAGHAQPVPTAALPVAENAPGFAPLDLRPPDELHTTTGAPGPDYWQQRADYQIQATLDPKTHQITGSETIRYTNYSPQELGSLWLQLDQNLFQPGAPETEAAPEKSRFSGAFRGGGFQISSVAVERGGRRVAATRLETDAEREGAEAGDEGEESDPDPASADRRARGGTTADGPGFRIRGTVMEVVLAEPLPADGGRLELHIEFAFTVPESGADRMGRLKVRRGTIYQIAQWYPRMFVYDDSHGWNTLPYLGQGEFYLEYGDFDVELTLPREFVVVATGVLQNSDEVYTEEQRRRLSEAHAAGDSTVTIIGRREVGRRESRPAGSGPLTWRFVAEDVRDFAWAASEAFMLDGGAWEDVLILSAYPQEGLGEFRPGWERSTAYVRHALRHYSNRWHPYPYPVAINVAGMVVGMEYPMIVFCTVEARGNGLFGVTDHEIAHGWFPMLVGSDERRHAWMDEGMVQFLGVFSETEFQGERSPGNPANPAIVARQMGSDAARKPILTQPDRMTEEELGFLAYFKPAAGLLLLRDYILGAEPFDAALRAYIERWKEKHPTPADFFRTMEDISGEELDWFWRGWLASTAVVDQAVTEVVTEGEVTRVTVENRGDLFLPVELRFLYMDGGDECRRIPVWAWLFGDAFTVRTVGREVRNVQVDPRGVLPDVNSANNVWGRGIVVRRESC